MLFFVGSITLCSFQQSRTSLQRDAVGLQVFLGHIVELYPATLCVVCHWKCLSHWCVTEIYLQSGLNSSLVAATADPSFDRRPLWGQFLHLYFVLMMVYKYYK